MRAEKRIVERWLHEQGFFTLGSLNAGRNRVVDIIAIRHGAGIVERIWHVEVDGSLVSPAITTRDRIDLLQRFDEKNVQEAVKRAIFDHLGTSHPYEKVIVTSLETLKLQGVITIPFENILLETLLTLDTHNYDNETIRTLQLVKTQILGRRKALRKLITHQEKGKRARLIQDISNSEESKAYLRSKRGEKTLFEALEGSTLASSEWFGKHLLKRILKRRARQSMLAELYQSTHEDSKDATLEAFIEK